MKTGNVFSQTNSEMMPIDGGTETLVVSLSPSEMGGPCWNGGNNHMILYYEVRRQERYMI